MKPSKEELYRLYWEEGLTPTEIAKRLTTPRSNIKRWLKKMNIPRRTHLEGIRLRDMKRRRFDQREEKEVCQLYEQGYSADEIAQLLGIGHTLVYKTLTRKGIRKRSLSEALSNARKKKYWYTGGKPTKETKRKISLSQRNRWQENHERLSAIVANNLPKEPSEKQLKASLKKPNKEEIQLIELLQEYNLPFKYVGNGEFILGGKCPDFINVNGRKQVIEFFGNHWHDVFDIARRKEHFRQYGFDTLIIWEEELKDQEKLVKKLKKFAKES